MLKRHLVNGCTNTCVVCTVSPMQREFLSLETIESSTALYSCQILSKTEVLQCCFMSVAVKLRKSSHLQLV